MKCPTQATLADYARDALDDQTLAELEAHLNRCRQCAQAAGAAVDDDLIDRVRDAAENATLSEEDACLLKRVQATVTTTISGDECGTGL